MVVPMRTETIDDQAPVASGKVAERRSAGNSNEDGGPGDASRERSGPDENETSSGSEKPSKTRLFRNALIVLILVPLVTVGAVKGYRLWAESRHFETTDDAFVDGHISQVASQVSGRVQAILVSDNQQVSAGQLLLQIDPRDYEVKMRQAEAQRASAVAQVEQMKAQFDNQAANIDQGEANIRASEADALQARQDYKRYSSVLPEAVTGLEVDKSSASAKSTAAKVDAAKHSLAASKAQLTSIRAQIVGAQAKVAQADTELDNASLQRSYTRLVAPTAGRVTKRTVELGNYVNPGQALLSVVPNDVGSPPISKRHSSPTWRRGRR